MANHDEDPFDLIHIGNAFSSSSSHWSAADAYSRASVALRHRANAKCLKNEPQTARQEEEQKIALLYRTQSIEYFFKARDCLLKALEFENEQDRTNSCQVTGGEASTSSPTCCLIGSDEAERRRRIFERLFVMQYERDDSVDNSKDVTPPVTHGDESSENTKGMEIPAAPSSSLPSIETTISEAPDHRDNDSQQRLNEIQSGLKRLGVSLPEDSNNKPIIKEMSDEDQVKLIMQQAADEVRVENGNDVANGNINNNESVIDENDSMFDDYEDEQFGNDDDLDALLIKVEKMVAAAAARDEAYESTSANDGQTSVSLFDGKLQTIRNAQALLLEARLCLEIERDGSSDHIIPLEGDTETTEKQSDDVVANSENVQDGTLQRRNKARDRIESAIRCLQDGLVDWTQSDGSLARFI